METSKTSNATACSLEITVDHRTFVWISFSKKCPLCIPSHDWSLVSKTGPPISCPAI